MAATLPRLTALLVGVAIAILGSCGTTAPKPAPPTPLPDLGAIPDYVPPPVAELTARTVRTYDAPEADQGVAVDATYFYPVDNTVIGKYRRDTGNLVGRFVAPNKGLIRHLNSCYARDDQLWCANSNYPLTPMGSSVEVFDARTMQHVDSRSLGMTDEGSLTWFDDLPDGRIAGFAHYSGNGGLPFKNHRYASVVTFDDRWRRTGGWLFPETVVARMAPHAASGGALGPDGLLYILGHDLPEMYVLARPVMGPTLIHVATIALEAEGQAFSFTPDGERTVFTIDRRAGHVRQIALPDLPPLPVDAQAFRKKRSSPD